MGCNYYLVSDPCKECGKESFRRHIGKSSVGWQFHFRAYPEDNIFCYHDWVLKIKHPNFYIIDEYDIRVSVEEFIHMVSCKKTSISPWNIHSQIPMSAEEKVYLGGKAVNCRMYTSWKDNEGHSFSDAEFC